MEMFSCPFEAVAWVGVVGIVFRLCVAFAMAAEMIPGSFWTGAVGKSCTLVTIDLLKRIFDDTAVVVVK